jgi:hypothetical protein
MSCLRLEAVVTRVYRSVRWLRAAGSRVRCGDGMALALPVEPCYDEDPECFRDLWDS